MESYYNGVPYCIHCHAEMYSTRAPMKMVCPDGREALLLCYICEVCTSSLAVTVFDKPGPDRRTEVTFEEDRSLARRYYPFWSRTYDDRHDVQA